MSSAFLASRSSLLRRRPLVVATLTGRRDLAGQLRRAASPFVDVVEVRLDTFRGIYRPGARDHALSLVDGIRRRCRKPLMLTLRSHTERGSAAPAVERLTDAERERILAPLLPGAALVDVEVRRAAFARRVAALARRLAVGVIGSFHDFKTVARPAVLDGWAARARRLGADIFKVAVTPKNADELEAFLNWGNGLAATPRVLIGMGAAGAPSRVLGYTFGSLLTYGHLGTAAAPGQMAAADLGRAVRKIYGGGRG